MMNLLAVFVGGGLGSLMRYIISIYSVKIVSGFPLGTLIANFLSCIILGAAVVFFSNQAYATSWKLFILVGICGGFSTFSTFSYETILLLKSGHFLLGILNIAISLALCIAVIYIIAKNDLLLK